MKKSIIMVSLTAILFTGCTTQDAYTGENKTSKATWGALGGAAVGAATGALVSKNNRGQGALIGAAAGTALGGGIGYYMDSQEAELRAELQASGVQVVRDGDQIRLVMPGNITFLSDSASINSGFNSTLDAVAKVMKKYSDTTIYVAGYTDNTGTDKYNNLLSQQRAQSVASYLQTSDLKVSRFEVVGFGKANPIASNTTTAGRQSNRRVEIKIIPTN